MRKALLAAALVAAFTAQAEDPASSWTELKTTTVSDYTVYIEDMVLRTDNGTIKALFKYVYHVYARPNNGRDVSWIVQQEIDCVTMRLRPVYSRVYHVDGTSRLVSFRDGKWVGVERGHTSLYMVQAACEKPIRK